MICYKLKFVGLLKTHKNTQNSYPLSFDMELKIKWTFFESAVSSSVGHLKNKIIID